MSRLRIVVAIVILFSLLSLRFLFLYHNRSKVHNGQHLTFETTLLSQPQIIGKYQRFSTIFSNGERIFVTIPRYPEFYYGETVRVSGIVTQKISSQKGGVPASKKMITTMFFPKIEAIKNPPLAIMSSVRQKIIFFFEKTLPPVPASLLLGIVFGIKEGMPKDFMESLRLSGVLHVVAASGMNVTMVAGFLTGAFSILFKRQIAIVGSIIGILFYAVLSGLEPSIMRATIMGVLAFSAQILGRQNLSLYALFLTGYLMLFLSPDLLFDVGFQLSFLATLGLLYIKPLLEWSQKAKRIIKNSLIGEDSTTSFSAQLITLPILLANFGSFSLWSIAVNSLVLWTIPILMILGGVGVMLGMVFDPLGQFFLYLALPFLLYFEKTVGFFAKLGGVVSINQFPWQFMVGYYCFLSAIIFLSSKRKK